MKELLNKIIYRSQETNLVMNLPKELELLDYMFVGKVDNKVEDEIYEFGLVFETKLNEIEATLRAVASHLNVDSVFWLAYPSRGSKHKGNVNPKLLHELALSLGFEQYTNISMNENWDAMRFVKTKQK